MLAPSMMDMSAQIACAVCAFHPLCHARSAHLPTPSPVEKRRRLAPGESLYRAGSPQEAIFALRAGFMKVLTPYPGGTHVVRFLLPGDVTGLDASATGVHRCDAVALSDCEVCEVPAYRAEILSDFSPRVGCHLRALLADELTECQQHAAVIASLDVKRRVAGFLADLGRRWLERGYSATAFQLPMSREEIGDYLGTTPETVSRVLSAFQANDWIKLRRRQVEILDERALAAVFAHKTQPELAVARAEAFR